MNYSEIPLQATSTDYQHARQERLKYRRLISQSIAAAIAVVCTVVVVVEPLNRAADNLLTGIRIAGKVAQTTTTTSQDLFDSLLPDWQQPLKKGQIFLGHKVTSDFGPRKSPCVGCSEFHRGTDLATPVGEPLMPPVEGDRTATVKCWADKKGGGLVADIQSPNFPGYVFKALHLQRCDSGEYKQGQVFARTGKSGSGTGPHLDLRQIKNGQYEPIAKGVAHWLLRGKAPSGGFSRGKWQEGMNQDG